MSLFISIVIAYLSISAPDSLDELLPLSLIPDDNLLSSLGEKNIPPPPPNDLLNLR